ncbi:MAG: cyclase family protein [Christensenella sp.]
MFKIKIIDITHELNNETKVYEGDPHVRLEQFFTIESYGYAVTKLTMGTHSGTHIDAPAHVVIGGKTAKEVSLSTLIGEAVLVDKKEFKVGRGTKRIILKGSHGAEGRLTEKSAQQLVDAGVRLIGTDAQSIGNDAVHKILLGEGIVVLESLNLEKAAAGNYILCALPLKIDTDGSPIRACLLQNWDEQ